MLFFNISLTNISKSDKIKHKGCLFAMIKIMLSRKLGELRITQKELSTITGIRANTINDLYHDIAERVSLEHLDKICEALECDLLDIMEFVPNQTRTVDKCKGRSIFKQKG